MQSEKRRKQKSITTMKHNWSAPTSYDTERFPVNREARNMLAKQAPLDLQDPNAQDAMGIAENLKGLGALGRGVSTTEVASLLCGLLKKREVVQTTLAPELIALKKQELAHKQAVFNQAKQQAKEKVKWRAEERARTAELLQCFKDIAKQTLPPEHYSIIMDLALEECRLRKSNLSIQPT